MTRHRANPFVDLPVALVLGASVGILFALSVYWRIGSLLCAMAVEAARRRIRAPA